MEHSEDRVSLVHTPMNEHSIFSIAIRIKLGVTWVQHLVLHGHQKAEARIFLANIKIISSAQCEHNPGIRQSILREEQGYFLFHHWAVAPPRYQTADGFPNSCYCHFVCSMQQQKQQQQRQQQRRRKKNIDTKLQIISLIAAACSSHSQQQQQPNSRILWTSIVKIVSNKTTTTITTIQSPFTCSQPPPHCK